MWEVSMLIEWYGQVHNEQEESSEHQKTIEKVKIMIDSFIRIQNQKIRTKLVYLQTVNA